jgi:hypothetical protein
MCVEDESSKGQRQEDDNLQNNSLGIFFVRRFG